MGTFTLNKIKVHCVYKFINNDRTFVIPPLGENVGLDGVTMINNRNAVLTKYTNVKFFRLVTSNSAFEHNIKFCGIFVDLVIKHRLKPCDIVYIDSVKYPFNYSDEFLKEIGCKSVFPGTLSKILTVRTIEYLLNHLSVDKKHSVFKTKLKDFKIYNPQQFKNSKMFLKVPSIYWHYGIEMGKKFEFLAGYLRVEYTLGYLILRNEQYKIACVLLNEENKMTDFSKGVEKILDRFVLIKNYKIFTEYYNDFSSVQYLVVNIRDIFVLKTGDFVTYYSPENQRKYWDKKHQNTEYFNITIHILHKSTVKNNGNYLKFTVHCIVLNHDNLECILQMKSALVENHPKFNDNDIFEIHTKMRFFKEAIESR